MPKFVRRQSFWRRIQAWANPYDLLLWFSEELESYGWDQLEKQWALPVGFGCNLVFLIAQANSGRKTTSYDDVFGEVPGPGWIAWFTAFIVHSLTYLSILNAFYTFARKRKYRLFEASVDAVPSTPSARRVRVDDSPVSSSPYQYIKSIWNGESAQSRAHPDPQRDVWEVSLWDPLPVSLHLFCYFSPGHVMLYWLFLPVPPANPRPGTTVATTVCLALLLSVQLSILRWSFSQQTKDSALISKEVLHEYDTKFVRQRTQPLYRDVGTQFTQGASFAEHRDHKFNTVETYTPSVRINRGFNPNPNPNYSQFTDPDQIGSRPTALRHQASTPNFKTPAQFTDNISPIRQSTAIKQPVFRQTTNPGDGGSLGVYSHSASPLRKSASLNFSAGNALKGDSHRDEAPSSPQKRAASPEKRMSAPYTGSTAFGVSQRLVPNKMDRHRRETGRF